MFSFEGISLQNAPLAQLVERAAVNRVVVGSSPTWGAINAATRCFRVAAFLLKSLFGPLAQLVRASGS